MGDPVQVGHKVGGPVGYHVDHLATLVAVHGGYDVGGQPERTKR